MPEPANHWRRTAKIVSTTVLVTSAVWLIGGAILFQRLQPSEVPQAPAAATLVASIGSPGAERASLAASILPPSEVPLLVVPVVGVKPSQLVDTFTQARENGTRTHNAIDIMAPLGKPVAAAAAGRVERLFVSARGGTTVYVRSPDRTLIYYYAHLDVYAPGLAEGQMVSQGQPLGTVGYSGDASPEAPHLHFEIQQTSPATGWWQGKVQLNPYPLLMRR